MENYEREQELAALAAMREPAAYEIQVQSDAASEAETSDEDYAEVEMPETPQIVELD